MSSDQFNVSDVYQLFVDCYRDFDEKFDRTSVNEEAVVCFGVSGAGKSTFLNRLLNRLPVQEFLDVIKQQGAHTGASYSFKDQPDLPTLGHMVESCTLVPEKYSVSRDLPVYDVPGFKDTNVNKQIVINILHKCLMTRVERSQFLVIIDVEKVFELRLTGLIDDYHNTLRDLFGPRFKQSMKYVHFVLTHKDKHGYSDEEIEEKLKTNTLDAMEIDNPDLPVFLNRLRNHHLVVDYTKHDGEWLKTELRRMLRETGEPGSITQDQLNKEQLDVYSNKLHSRCEQFLQRKVRDAEEQRQAMDIKHARILAELERLAVQALAAANKVKLEENLRTEKLLENEELEKRITGNTARLESCSAEMEKRRVELESFRSQEAFLLSQLSSISSVSLRQDLSLPGSLGNYAGRQFVRTVVAIEGNVEDSVMLVTAAEPDDATLKGYIGNDGRLIPDNLDRINRCDLDVVWYNSKSHAHKTEVLEKVNMVKNPADKTITLEIVGRSRFKVFLYTSVPFSETAAGVLLRHHWDVNSLRCKQALLDLTEEMNRLAKENSESTALISKNHQLLESKKQTLKIARETQDTDTERYLAAKEAALLTLSQSSELLQDCLNDKSFVRVMEIEQIFSQNDLKSTLTGLIGEYKEKIAQTQKDRDKKCELIIERHTEFQRKFAAPLQIQHPLDEN